MRQGDEVGDDVRERRVGHVEGGGGAMRIELWGEGQGSHMTQSTHRQTHLSEKSRYPLKVQGSDIG